MQNLRQGVQAACQLRFARAAAQGKWRFVGHSSRQSVLGVQAIVPVTHRVAPSRTIRARHIVSVQEVQAHVHIKGTLGPASGAHVSRCQAVRRQCSVDAQHQHRVGKASKAQRVHSIGGNTDRQGSVPMCGTTNVDILE